MIHAIQLADPTLNLKQDKLPFQPNHSALMEADKKEVKGVAKIATNEIFKRNPDAAAKSLTTVIFHFSRFYTKQTQQKKGGVRKMVWLFLRGQRLSKRRGH